MSAALLALQRFVAHAELPRPDSLEHANELASLARGHGLCSLLDEALVGAPFPWPKSAAAALRDVHRLTFLRSLLLRETERRARRLLALAGLRSLPLKGAALVELAYDSRAHRPMADVDLLLLDDWPRAALVLAQAGFSVRERAEHAWAFHDSGAGVTLELHRGLCACPAMFPIDAETLWSRRTGEPGDERPAPEDLLVQLSVHAAFQHGLGLSLVQFLDFRRLLERAPPDPARLLDAAAAARAEACLLVALSAARALVGAEVKQELLEPLRRAAPRRLLKKLDRALMAPLALVSAPPPPAAIASWRLVLVSSRRLELVARTLFPADRGSPVELARRGLRLLRRTLV